ncbi:glycosyltransferase family 2 protein [Cryobacterium sp. 5B3]|uniref:glycosyltransferase family 2 protein n=1 Tax=Cryobacterium sp. 5B3 TaxID=3048586 RepID=UPI002AB53EF6|nr:glycosyltransferase family 2 protein [Cryobacterium sp. 5B3]MDY7540919.1 glycosyltransferase family 2 protein [Cryobacterium sp. 5B3]MEB0276142.1 glycosyltransferase family 2 protein [Cryobacterium sp. 5B3]
MMPLEDLRVIVVTYNSARVIADCLSELVSSELCKDVEFVVVDNDSKDETLKIVRGISGRIRIIRNIDNVGFAKAVNIGARSTHASAILLLNPDAIISASALLELRLASASNNRTILAPLIVHPDGRLRIVSAGRFPSVWRLFCHYSGISRFGKTCPALEGHYLLPNQLQMETSTDWVTGACMLIPSQIWSHLGGLTEQWFMYAEDIEFCWKAKQAGYGVALLRKVTTTHAVGESTDEPKSLNADWITNLFDFYRTSMNGSTLSGTAWKLVVVLGLLSRSVAFRVRGHRTHNEPDRRFWVRESKRFYAFAQKLGEVRL